MPAGPWSTCDGNGASDIGELRCGVASGTVTLPLGVNTALVTVMPWAGAVVEAGELVTLTLIPDAACVIGTPGTGNGVIADPAPPAGTGLFGQYYDTAVVSNGVYQWTFGPTGGLTVADVVAGIQTGNAYLNIHTAPYPAGEIKGVDQLAAGSQTFTPPAPPPPLPGGPPTVEDAARFLAQATFGATTGELANVQSLGFDAWLTQQFALPASSHLQFVND